MQNEYEIHLPNTLKKNRTIRRVDGQKQLFLDDSAIACMEGLRRVMYIPAKHPDNPVIQGDRLWERGVLHPVTALYDPHTKAFHMWYRATSAPPGHEARESLCYARSHDGVHWEKPELEFVRLSEEEGGTPNNILDSGTPPVMAFVEPDTEDPAKRLVLLRGGPVGMSLAIFTSPDGLHWQKEGETTDLRDAARTLPNPHAKYVYTGQCWAGKNAWGAGKRGVMRCDSDDLLNWGGNATIFSAGPDDSPNLEFYTMSMNCVRLADSYNGWYLGFLHLFHTDPGGKRHPVNQVAMSGSIDVYLAVSRDTVRWSLIDRDQPFLPLGPEGSFDSGMVFIGAMCEFRDRLHFYYSGWNVEHGELIGTPTKEGRALVGLATLRLDGFVALEPEGNRGVMVTNPFVVDGDWLEVNVNAVKGQLIVEVLDGEGDPIPGFDAAHGRPITSDGLRERVMWEAGSSLSALRGKIARLRFGLTRDVSLYAFQIKEIRKHK